MKKRKMAKRLAEVERRLAELRGRDDKPPPPPPIETPEGEAPGPPAY